MNDVQTIERKVRTPLQKKFFKEGFVWETLERNGGIVLLKGIPASRFDAPIQGGRKRFDVSPVILDEHGAEQVTLSWGVKPLQTGVPESENDWRWYEQRAREHYAYSLTYNEIRKSEREAEKQAIIASSKASELWEKKVKHVREVQTSLISELKSLNRASEDLNFFETKEAKAILTKLSQISEYLHHAK
jgi:hypothetical protein